MQIGGEILHRTPAQHDLLGAELDLNRNWRLRDRRHERAQARQQSHRLSGAIVLGDKLVGIELPRRQHGMKQRRGTKANVPEACELQRALFGTVAGLDLFEPRGGRIGLDPGRHPPGRDWHVARGLEPGGSGQNHCAFEARRTRLEAEHAIEIGGQCTRAGINVEMNAGAIAVDALTG